MKSAVFTVLFASSLLLSPGAGRSEDVLSSVRVYTANESVRPGDRVPIAVQLTVADGWHTYAKEPGDSGMPPSIAISGPEGLTVGEWRFPPPQTFIDSVGTTYGYEHQVVLLSDLQIPENVADGTVIELTADIQWMICRDICVFQTGSQTLFLRVESLAAPEPSSEWKRLLEESRWSARSGENE